MENNRGDLGNRAIRSPVETCHCLQPGIPIRSDHITAQIKYRWRRIKSHGMASVGGDENRRQNSPYRTPHAKHLAANRVLHGPPARPVPRLHPRGKSLAVHLQECRKPLRAHPALLKLLHQRPRARGVRTRSSASRLSTSSGNVVSVISHSYDEYLLLIQQHQGGHIRWECPAGEVSLRRRGAAGKHSFGETGVPKCNLGTS